MLTFVFLPRVLMFLACSCVISSVLADLPSERLPNLVIIQTDEHNFRTLGCYRDTLPSELAQAWGKDAIVDTPAIDSIAARGAICTSFYATSPVCTPSRASFFSGRYPHQTGSPQNDLPLDSSIVTFAETLKQLGYATGYAGKWHLDGPGKPQWAPKRQFGFTDNRFMYNRGHWKHFELTADGPRVASRDKSGKPSYSLGNANEKTFSTDWLMDRAIEFIQEHADEPICYHLSLPDPHGPNSVRPPYDAQYADMAIRPPVTFAQTENNPKWAAVGARNSASRFNPNLMSLYFGMVRCIDDNVQRLLQSIEELGLTENTIIVFTSDHGDLCFEHGRLNKGNPYEGSAKIPMIVAAPGRIPAGTRIDVALGTVDFAPTILSLMDVPDDKLTAASERMTGRNAAAWFRGKTPDAWNDVTVLRSAGLKPSWIAAVTDRYKLVFSVADEPWLFDLKDDPDELVNHYKIEEYQPIVQELNQSLLQYSKKTNDPHLSIGNPIRKQLRQVRSSQP